MEYVFMIGLVMLAVVLVWYVRKKHVQHMAEMNAEIEMILAGLRATTPDRGNTSSPSLPEFRPRTQDTEVLYSADDRMPLGDERCMYPGVPEVEQSGVKRRAPRKPTNTRVIKTSVQRVAKTKASGITRTEPERVTPQDDQGLGIIATGLVLGTLITEDAKPSSDSGHSWSDSSASSSGSSYDSGGSDGGSSGGSFD